MTLPVLFLPGILMPAKLRYERLFAALGHGRELIAKELEVYRGETPPVDYAIATEADGIMRIADDHGWSRFHLYGHSGGGACAIAFAALHPERVATLALDEPAFDFTDEARAELVPLLPLLDNPAQMMPAFARQQMRSDLAPPPPPSGPPPPWMANRPAGIAAFVRALAVADVPVEQLRAPVYYSHGTLSNESWIRMAHRLVDRVPRITVERYEGRSHFDTSHSAEPERVASALQRLWRPD